ncbi:MAG: tetratricopeptide repeat protein [Acidobacteria bacterium]|nr:tetratricopeptide repeat protein [Acidobacteriota bacterium]
MNRLLMLVVSCAFLTPGIAHAQHEDHAAMASDQIGAAHVQFETSCTGAVRADFNKGVALLHSFWFPQAIAAFEDILKKDPGCAMAHWGIALSTWGNPFAGIKNAKTVEVMRLAIERAKATGSPSPRERAFIDAVAQLAVDTAAATHAARIAAYEAAMAQLTRDHGADVEARLFYALAINQTAPATDKTYAKQMQAGAILEPLFVTMPEHPGVAHYIIHAYDAPPLAARALVAARKYASLAPAIPHALHMPSHTFTRVGSWTESIETNRRSAEAARKSNGAGEELHALDYQAYAYLQTAQDQAAKAVLDHALSVVGGAEGVAAGAAGAGAYSIAAIPARYALERGAWAEAAALVARPANTPYTQAITHFARALGAARSGNPAAAAADIEQLAALRDKLKSMQDVYWTEQVDIQRRVATAWQTFAQGAKDEGIVQLNAAADAEDATDKSAVSPGPIAPARELLGFMLLDAGRPQDALAAFEATMKKEPNRFRGAYGAARAAEGAGDKVKARSYYKQLLEIAKDADTERAEIVAARTFIG